MTITIRPTTHDDLPVLFEFQREPEANEMSAFPPRDHDAFMAHWDKVLAMEAVVSRTIVEGETIVGSIGCFEMDGEWMVGYWIGTAFWGRGIATRALELLLDEVETRPLLAYVAKRNAGSIRVLEKCGFEQIGENTHAAPTGGEEVEEFLYSIS